MFYVLPAHTIRRIQAGLLPLLAEATWSVCPDGFGATLDWMGSYIVETPSSGRQLVIKKNLVAWIVLRCTEKLWICNCLSITGKVVTEHSYQWTLSSLKAEEMTMVENWKAPDEVLPRQ
jgi:hypothetical protein